MPWTPASIRRLMALPPAPPTPIARISVKPRASVVSAATICWTTPFGRGVCVSREGSKPPRLATTQHLTAQCLVGLDSPLAAVDFEDRHPARRRFQYLAVGANFRLEDEVAPGLPQV